MNYIKINREILQQYFEISKGNNEEFVLRASKGANTIKIAIPFVLNEDVATLAGMMPDGSLIKNLRRIYFTQKK